MNSHSCVVSIIVNSFNPNGDLRIRTMTELALRCYRAFTGPTHELILVDGHANPDPHLSSICIELGYHYLQLGKTLSFAEGYNAGLSAARAPWRVLAANDIFVVAGWLEAMLSTAEETRAWMVSPYLSSSDYPAQRIHQVLVQRTFVPEFLTLNLNLISPRCMEMVGHLDEQFSGCFNDVDYALRIRQQGGEVAIAYCGEITHLGRGTLGVSGVYAMYARDLPRFEAKWPGIWNPKTYRLNGQQGLKGWLLWIDRILPTRLSWCWRDLLDRIEPVLRPSKKQSR